MRTRIRDVVVALSLLVASALGAGSAAAQTGMPACEPILAAGFPQIITVGDVVSLQVEKSNECANPSIFANSFLFFEEGLPRGLTISRSGLITGTIGVQDTTEVEWRVGLQFSFRVNDQVLLVAEKFLIGTSVVAAPAHSIEPGPSATPLPVGTRVPLPPTAPLPTVGAAPVPSSSPTEPNPTPRAGPSATPIAGNAGPAGSPKPSATAAPTSPPAAIATGTPALPPSPATTPPSPTFEAQPDASATSDPTPSPIPQAEPDAVDSTSVPDTNETPDPDAPDLSVSSLDPGSQTAVDLVPGLLTTEWPPELVVGRPGRIEVFITFVDWRPAPTPYPPDGKLIEVEGDDGRLRLEVAMYAIEGPIDVEIVVDQQHLKLVDPLYGGPVDAVQTIHPGLFGDKAVWFVEAIAEGKAWFRISTHQAIDPRGMIVDDDQLEGIPINTLELDRELRIVTTSDVGWAPPPLWVLVTLGLLPMFPVAGIRTRTRFPLGVGPLPASGPAVPSGQGTVGLILSGGGMRAAAFSTGVCMFLADTGQWSQIRQVASVSGGSFTNAFVAQLSSDEGAPPRSAGSFAYFMQSIARRGLHLEMASRLFLFTVVVGSIGTDLMVYRIAPSFLVALPWLIVAPIAFGFLSWLLFVWAGITPAIKAWIPRFTRANGDCLLHQLGRGTSSPITHIFTASTKSARVHLSPEKLFISAELDPAEQSMLRGEPDELTAAEAVRASSAFPGLPRVSIRSSKAGFHGIDKRLILVDGGSKNNLGHIETTLDRRHGPTLNRFLTAGGAINNWVVVDSSAYRKRVIAHVPFFHLIVDALHLGFAADAAELAQSGQRKTTEESAGKIRKHFARTSEGIYLALGESPLDYLHKALALPGYAADTVDITIADGHHPMAESRTRARSALNLVLATSDQGSPSREWGDISSQNLAVDTTLRSLGDERTLRLVRHGYVLAAVKAHVALDWPLPAPESTEHERFQRLLDIDATKVVELVVTQAPSVTRQPQQRKSPPADTLPPQASSALARARPIDPDPTTAPPRFERQPAISSEPALSFELPTHPDPGPRQIQDTPTIDSRPQSRYTQMSDVQPSQRGRGQSAPPPFRGRRSSPPLQQPEPPDAPSRPVSRARPEASVVPSEAPIVRPSIPGPEAPILGPSTHGHPPWSEPSIAPPARPSRPPRFERPKKPPPS